MFDRQFEVFNAKCRALLVSGPRKSGKTLAVLHKIVRHMFDTPGASVAMYAKTLKTSKDGGTWSDLHNIILPEWIGAGIGLHYTTLNAEGVPGPKVDGQTRTPFFRIKNRFGGESELRLFSLDFDDDIESKIKEQRFSLIYFSELDKFNSRKVLSIALPQLRMTHLSRDDQMWIADTNPSEEGEESWIYEVFYKERLEKSEDENIQAFRNDLKLIEIKPEENPFLDPRDLAELKATYIYDNDLYNRYVLGLWILGQGAAGRHFSGYFIESVHVVGQAAGPKEDWIYLNPSPTCSEILTGWDLGDTNHSAHVVEKIGYAKKSVYHVLEELVSIKQDVSIADFTSAFLLLVQSIEKAAGKSLFCSRNWSDKSSLEKYSATADTYPYLEVAAASEGRFDLQGVPKAPGSVRQRVRVLKRLLRENRIKVSAHCKATIEMLKYLRKGDTEINFVIPDKHKHAFDSLTYLLLMEMMDDLEETASGANLGKRTSIDISIPL